jgi:hypothetical protein
MYRSSFLTCMFAVACATGPQVGDTGATHTPTIQATVRVLDATTGTGVADVSVENTQAETSATTAEGQATLSVPAHSNFQLRLRKEGFIDHVLFGPTAGEDFEYVSFFASESMMNTVISMLGITPAPGTGLIVVGIDYDDLSPAVGATASIGSIHDNPWVLTQMGPTFGDTITDGAMGMVAFSSVPPGSVSVNVTPPTNAACTAFPGGGAMPAVPVAADQVTVVTFHCR